MLTIDNLRVFNIRGGGLHPVLVELSTKDGIKGYGEAAVAYGIGANAAAGMLSDLAHKVVGQDATYPRNIWHEIYDNAFWTKGGGAIVFAALSAIDQALWDIKAQSLGIPVYELFGAKFESSLEVYANGWNTDHDDAMEWAKAAERPLKDGYTILKCYPLATRQEGGTLRHVQRRSLSPEEFKRAIDRVRALRKVVGPDISLMFDLSGGLNNDQLIRFMEGGLRLHQRGLLGLAAQGHDRRAGGDVLAAFEMHLLDDFADLGGHADRFARLGRAQRLQGVAPLPGLHHLRSDRHRFSLPTCGSLLFACAPGQHGQAEAKGQGRSDTSQHERS